MRFGQRHDSVEGGGIGRTRQDAQNGQAAATSGVCIGRLDGMRPETGRPEPPGDSRGGPRRVSGRNSGRNRETRQERENIEIMDMAGWPATLGPVRLSRAEAVISRDAHRERSILDGRKALPDEARRDARMLLGVLEIMDFSAWAHGEAERLVRAGRINSALDIAEVALQGTSERFIGTVIHLTEGTSEQEEYIL